MAAKTTRAPKGDFALYLRVYWPKVEVIDGPVGAAGGGEEEVEEQR